MHIVRFVGVNKNKALMLAEILLAMAVLLADVFAAESVPTYFIDRQGRFSGWGSYAYNGFTVRSTTTFVFRYAADYNSQAAIIPANQLQPFINNQRFRGWGVFNNTFGVDYLTLAPGRYYVAARSSVNGSNSYAYELDTDIRPAQVPGYYYYNSPLNKSAYVNANGGWYYHGFYIAKGSRYFLDGCNSGGGAFDSYTIPASQLSNFTNNRGFVYYPSLSGRSSVDPGNWEMRLPMGNYYLAFKNRSPIRKAVVYTMERWVRR